jgi:hypothetical protein
MITVYHVIIDEMGHEGLEIAAWLSQLFIVVIALIAAYVARGQLKEMGVYRQQRVRIANAQLLLELDNRWDSKDMHGSRLIFARTHNAITQKVGGDHPIVKDGERKKFIQEAWAEELQKKRGESPQEYAKLMDICGFFETVGLMVDKNYIQFGDVVELFGGPIDNVGTCFGGHIAAREKEMGVLAGLYKHALNLSRRAAAGS